MFREGETPSSLTTARRDTICGVDQFQTGGVDQFQSGAINLAKQIRDVTELLERVLALKYGAPPKPALDAAMRRLKARDRRAARRP